MTGTPIPPDGDLVVRAICAPDTWLSLVSELLFQATPFTFWDNLATLEDVEDARKIAADIVGSFNSEDCSCEDGNCPGGNYYAFDFEQSEGGWSVPSGGYSVYDSGTGWKSEEVEIGGQTYAKLDTSSEEFPA